MASSAEPSFEAHIAGPRYAESDCFLLQAKPQCWCHASGSQQQGRLDAGRLRGLAAGSHLHPPARPTPPIPCNGTHPVQIPLAFITNCAMTFCMPTQQDDGFLLGTRSILLHWPCWRKSMAALFHAVCPVTSKSGLHVCCISRGIRIAMMHLAMCMWGLVLQCLLHMPQVGFALGTAAGTVKAQALAKAECVANIVILVLQLQHVGALQAAQPPLCRCAWCVLSPSKLMAQRALVQAQTVARSVFNTGQPVSQHSCQEVQNLLDST